MSKFNDFFINLAEKIPFAKDFFKSNLSILGIEISNLFLVLISLLLIVIAIVLIITLAASNHKKKKTEKAVEEAVDTLNANATESACTQEQSADNKQDTVIADKEAQKTEALSNQKVVKEKALPLEDEVDTAKEEQATQEEKVEEAKSDLSAEDTNAPEELAATATLTAQPEEEFIEYPIKSKPQVEKAQAEPKAQAEKVQAEKVQAEPKTESDKRYSGKYEIYVTPCGYRFYLMASNGQLLYESNGYTSVDGATKGIDTFKNAVNNGTFLIDEDKFGKFRFVLNKRYVGENYDTKTSCENSIGSVKKFSQTATLTPYVADKAKEKIYKDSLEAQKNQKEVNWEEIEKEEAQTKPSGKFEISQTSNGFRFVLLANNGQLLYSSNGYASYKSAFEGIKTFKRTVYTGNFFVDEDKFGRFRYILRGATFITTYTGESYTTKSACEKIIESVKKFVKSAVMPD